MFTPPARRSAACCALVIPTRRMSLSATGRRLIDRAIDAVAAWRRHRHDARYLGYLGEPALKEIGLDRSTLLAMGIDPRQPGDRERFPF